jgi:hypothetical protein
MKKEMHNLERQKPEWDASSDAELSELLSKLSDTLRIDTFEITAVKLPEIMETEAGKNICAR